jgi:nucleotide-binding universal stress UspA family protein
MLKIEFKHILVPTDFGEHAAHALDVAIALATKLDATLTLLHVHYLPPPAYEFDITWPIEELEVRAQQALDAALATAKQRYPKCDRVFERGYPSDRIVETAKKRDADLIVIGTHGRRGIPRMLLGSVAEKVVRTAPMPVLTVSADKSDGTSDPAGKAR